MSTSPVEKVKLWIFPTLVSIIGLFIYSEIKEIQADVKALLAQSNIDKTRIDNLERSIYNKPVSSKDNNMPVPPAPIKFLLTEFIPAKNEMDDEES